MKANLTYRRESKICVVGVHLQIFNQYSGVPK